MRVAWLVLAGVAFAAGCSGGTKAGGGPPRHTIVLTIANHETSGRDLTEYIAAVNRLSDGSIRLEGRDGWRGAEVDYDRGTVADVRAGKVDLAKIAVRSFDTLGVSRFQALMAPFLVDSVGLEQQILASPLADEMLAGVSRLGVVGVAMLPGEPRRPFGQRRRFLAPSDYRGVLFGIRPSRVSNATLRDLGALPQGYVSGDLPYSFAGAELDLYTIEESGYDTSATSLTRNVVFWPRAFVIVANRKTFAKLTAQQRDLLRRAARDALAPAIVRLRTEELDSARILCRRGQLAFVDSTRTQLAALRAAVQPVYATLERNPKTASLIRRIEAMKRGSAPARAARCARPQPAEKAATPLEGTWEMTAGRAHGIDAGRYRLVLQRGRVLLFHLSPPRWGGPPAGAFRVHDDTVVFRFADGTDAVYRWNVYRDMLTLRYTARQVGPPNPTFAPWHRVSR